MEWAVGVMAAPRYDLNGLRKCLTALEDAGWKPFVFAEPGISADIGEYWPTIYRPNTCVKHPSVVPGPTGKFGNVQNWIQTAADLLEIDETAAAYVTVEDDAVVCRQAKTFMERLLWPSERCGAITIYAANIPDTRKHYPQMFLHRRYGIMGTLFMIWRPECLRQIVWGDGVPAHMATLPCHPADARGVDTWLGNELNRIGWEMWTVTPSLVQHWHPIGRMAYSALGHGPPIGKRQAYRFVGMNANLDQVFGRYLRQVNR